MSNKISSSVVTRLEKLRHELSSGQDVGYIVDQILVLLLEREEARLERFNHTDWNR